MRDDNIFRMDFDGRIYTEKEYYETFFFALPDEASLKKAWKMCQEVDVSREERPEAQRKLTMIYQDRDKRFGKYTAERIRYENSMRDDMKFRLQESSGRIYTEREYFSEFSSCILPESYSLEEHWLELKPLEIDNKEERDELQQKLKYILPGADVGPELQMFKITNDEYDIFKPKSK